MLAITQIHLFEQLEKTPINCYLTSKEYVTVFCHFNLMSLF